jgi:hypothetical protein
MREQLIALLKSPTRENYLALWERVTTRPDFAPYVRDLDQAQRLIESERYLEADQLLNAVRIRYVLSPRFHFQKQKVLAQLGDRQASEAEQAIGFACIDGLLAVGDGSRDRPYFVTSTNDEYYVLGALDLRSVEQSLAKEIDRVFDVHVCDGGREIYFDITRVYGALEHE